MAWTMEHLLLMGSWINAHGNGALRHHARLHFGATVLRNTTKAGQSPMVAVADQTDRDTFDCECGCFGIDDDRRELRVFRHQHDVASATREPLDRHIVVQARDDDLARMRIAL